MQPSNMRFRPLLEDRRKGGGGGGNLTEVSQAKGGGGWHKALVVGRVNPLVDLPSLPQPPSKSYCIAITQRHLTVTKRNGKEG